jgi:hypothetical protein
MVVANKYTDIMSQIDDGSTALTVFTTVQQAKDFYLSANAQQNAIDNATQVQYALIADGNGDNTKLKRTLGFDLSCEGAVYITKMTELLTADDFKGSAVKYTTAQDSTHLF